MASVIVPAHNEEAVIANCIDSLIQQPSVECIIVACNGCTDSTVEIVEAYAQRYPQLKCLNLEKPSKTYALNQAEKNIKSYPIFYIDADTQLNENSVQKVSDYLESHPELALVAPMPDIDVSQSSWFVKQYYRIWLQLPYIKAGVIATCSFVVTEEGRKRFGQFPDIIADDGFIRCQFNLREISNVPDTSIKISAPRNLYSLIRIKTRARLGNMQLKQLKLCKAQHHKAYVQSAYSLVGNKNLIATSVYYAIATTIRVRAWFQFRKLNQYKWEKDHSSR